MRICSVNDCNKEHMAKGYCSKHYDRWKKNGSAIARTKKDPNEFVDCGDYWEIKIYDRKCNHVASAKIDSEDVEKCRQYKWHLDSVGYVVSDNSSSRILLHRFVMGVTDPFIEIDHIYGDRLDNRKNQLRVCSHAQNCQNIKLPRHNTSGERNVFWDRQVGKWKVEITAFGKRYYFGLFEDMEEACQVARTERKRLHEEFANDN